MICFMKKCFRFKSKKMPISTLRFPEALFPVSWRPVFGTVRQLRSMYTVPNRIAGWKLNWDIVIKRFILSQVPCKKGTFSVFISRLFSSWCGGEDKTRIKMILSVIPVMASRIGCPDCFSIIGRSYPIHPECNRVAGNYNLTEPFRFSEELSVRNGKKSANRNIEIRSFCKLYDSPERLPAFPNFLLCHFNL